MVEKWYAPRLLMDVTNCVRFALRCQVGGCGSRDQAAAVLWQLIAIPFWEYLYLCNCMIYLPVETYWYVSFNCELCFEEGNAMSCPDCSGMSTTDLETWWPDTYPCSCMCLWVFHVFLSLTNSWRIENCMFRNMPPNHIPLQTRRARSINLRSSQIYLIQKTLNVYM